MKKIIKTTVFIFYLAITQGIIAQDISQDDKNRIIGNLDSISHSSRLEAVLDVYQYNIIEALPKLESKIFMQEQDIAFWYLKSIGKFKSSDIIRIARTFIDTIEYLPRYDNYKEDRISITQYKIEATFWLFKNGDYSTANIIFNDLIETPIIGTTEFVLLEQMLNHVPLYENNAKQELLNIAKSSLYKNLSPMAVVILSEKYGPELNSELINIFNLNEDYVSRINTLKFLDKNNYSDLENFLRSIIIDDSTIAGPAVEVLLNRFTTPSNYSFVLEKMYTSMKQSDIEYYSIWLKYFEPLPPKYYFTILQFLDYSFSLCDTLPLYTWLGDITFSNELKNILTTAKIQLENGDSLACRVQVKSFQDLVDNVYKDSLNPDPRFVAIEGWKFLYWNAQYILDRLPEQ